MTDFPIFRKGLKGASTAAPAPLAWPVVRISNDPSKYEPSEALTQAVNVALLLGMPLLVTGEPGAGKTDLGYAVAHDLGGLPVHKFETKSTSAAKDLFYVFDVLGRFAAREALIAGGTIPDARTFIRYSALGSAILGALPPEEAAKFLAPGEAHAGPQRSVVIIDEIDKAPRDFPNDVLNEIDRMAFRVPELGNIATPGMGGGKGLPDSLRPIVVITSNNERDLPDAFLRRCVFFHIPFPEDADLRRIVANRIEGLSGGSALVDSAIALFRVLREPTGRNALSKRPGTAELLNWLQILRALGFQATDTIKDKSALDRLTGSLATLVKRKEDHESALRALDGWLGRSD